MDKNLVCRLCLENSDEFYCIFDEETGDLLPEIVHLFTTFNIQVIPYTDRSSMICIKCYSKLNDFYEFHTKCIENELLWDQAIDQDEEFADTKLEVLNKNQMDYILVDPVIEEKPKIIQQKEEIQRPKNVFIIKKSVRDRFELTEEDYKIQEFYDFSCKICTPSPSFISLSAYRSHMRTDHGDAQATISCCHRNMTKRHELIDHMTFHLDPSKFTCTECNKVFSDRKNLTAHFKLKHGSIEDRKYQCDICKKRFVSFEPLKIHLRTHMSNETKEQMRSYLCNECGKTFLSKGTLQAHFKYVHLRQGYICDLCSKTFKTKFELGLHRRNNHGEDGPARVQCDRCLLWYSNQRALKDHVRSIHERTQKIVCTLCGHEAASKAALRGHKKIKHDEKLHRCDYCGKALATLVRLREHISAAHTGISLYSCRYCPNKQFNMRSNMYKHYKTMHPDQWERDKADKNRNPQKWKEIESFNEDILIEYE
uniref:CSON012588 protein n=1 Tax=Culicoides sonorensis TaxID=179676 RepID=A0A336MHV3_CULSO